MSDSTTPQVEQPIGAVKNLSRAQKRKIKQNRAQRYKQKHPRPDYEPFVRHNDNLVKYYKQQSFFNDNEEFDVFLEKIKETLPASFRINSFDLDQANFLRNLIEGPELCQFLTAPDSDETKNQPEKVNELEEKQTPVELAQDDEVNTSKLTSADADNANTTNGSNQQRPPLEALCWYPKRLGWQMNISRLDLKRTPILQQFHRFLMAETDNGFISRQEAVSMIPPLLLDIRNGHNVLDMCAAPGSKTAQLLEYLKNDFFIANDKTDGLKQDTGNKEIDLFDDGVVVANDVDNKRCYMLVHQSNRLNSPNCIIINQDAGRLPNMKLLDESDGTTTQLKFDRILCDVPCSGDGTIRKNPDVWKKWSTGNANNFHGMQCKILRRGIELLKENGLLVYSTCSMMPTEDEAVISSILRASKGDVVLEDVGAKLPGLKFKPGTSDWVVMNQKMDVMPSIDKVPPEYSSQIYPSLFPPNEEERESFNLHKCIRILPHLQNTGGFFVAVLRKKTSALPWEIASIPIPKPLSQTIDGTDENISNSNSQPSVQLPPPNPKKRRFAGFKEDPFIFMDSEDPDWIMIKNVYGLSDKFPVGQLVHRCPSGKKRSIYLVSKRTRSFMLANREEPGRSDFVKIINGGMRLFSRADTEAGFRICQDGVNEIVPFIKDDMKVPINKTDLVALLKARSVGMNALSSSDHIKEKIKSGSFILIYRHEPDEEVGLTVETPIVAWKGEYTVALYVSKTFRVHLCALAQLKIDEDGANGTIKQEEQELDTKVKVEQ